MNYISLILDRLPGLTTREKFEALEEVFLPDGNVNYEAVILNNCLRLLGKEAQGRLIRNLIERGAEYTPDDPPASLSQFIAEYSEANPSTVADGGTDAP